MIGTLCCDRPACDTVTDVAKTGVGIQDLGRSGLKSSGEFDSAESWAYTYLGVLLALEKMCSADKPDVIVPRHCPLLLLTWDLERILEHWGYQDRCLGT